jgi:hypothetical protein
MTWWHPKLLFFLSSLLLMMPEPRQEQRRIESVCSVAEISVMWERFQSERIYVFDSLKSHVSAEIRLYWGTARVAPESGV